MTLLIPAEYEAILQEAVASGAFATPEEALQRALKLLAEENEEKKANNPVTPRLSEEERQKRLKNFEKWLATRKPAGHFVDDSRESIY